MIANHSRPQFRLRTLFVYTLVIAFGLAVLSRTEIGNAYRMSTIASVFVVPLLTLPSLWERAIDLKVPLRFGPLLGIFQLLAVSLHSLLGLLLSTLAFTPSWKGEKGHNWIFYINDELAAVVIYPFYIGGAIAFCYAIKMPKHAISSPFTMAAIAINALISFLYVFYVLVMRYISEEFWVQRLFVLVPGNAALAYSLMVIALWRRRDLTSKREPWRWMYAWCGGFLLAMVAKVPLAMRYYASLPNEPPQSCFIVTAASRGHPSIVGTSYNSKLCRSVNQQLVRFWKFEELLTDQFPRIHQSLRRIYNKVGPVVARLIVARWQADLVYLLLKPVEWLAVVVVRVRG